MTETMRHKLPLLAVAQAQKELTHNEALARIDTALHAAVADRRATPPTDPAEGECWLVGAEPAGAWAGREGQVAAWTSGGWRFADLPEGAWMWMENRQVRATRQADRWAEPPAIAEPAGGTVVDVEARQALSQLFECLRAQGLIAG